MATVYCLQRCRNQSCAPSTIKIRSQVEQRYPCDTKLSNILYKVYGKAVKGQLVSLGVIIRYSNRYVHSPLIRQDINFKSHSSDEGDQEKTKIKLHIDAIRQTKSELLTNICRFNIVMQLSTLIILKWKCC